MSRYLEDQQIAYSNGWEPDRLAQSDLQAIAAALGGTVQGRRIKATGPHGAALDLNFHSPTSFFVYDCSCGRQAAEAWVCAKLGLPLPTKATTADALKAWDAAVPAAGTLVEKYLRSRCITLQVPDHCIRFNSGCWHAEEKIRSPAMVALVCDHTGAAKAVHLTWLRRDGIGKSGVSPNRKTRGPIKHCMVQLAPAAEELAIGEGLETCLAYMQMTGMPTWSAMNAVNLRAIQLPTIVRRVVLLADCKSPDDPGPSACRNAAQRLLFERRQVRIATAPAGMDFNDVLIERKAQQCQQRS